MPSQTRRVRVVLLVLSALFVIGFLLFTFRSFTPTEMSSETAASRQQTSSRYVVAEPSVLPREPTAIHNAGVKLSAPSEAVVRHFPRAKLIESRQQVLGNGDIHRVELIETTMKYPLIRV